MSSLARYLAPTHAARSNPGHKVEWRHGEAGPWYPLDPSATRGVSKRQVEDLLASPPVSLVQGDLARVLDPKGQVVRFLVQTDEGLVALPAGKAYGAKLDYLRSAGCDWETLWEGWDRADHMLSFAWSLGVDQKALTLAACACAETALRYVPGGEDRPRVAIETARRWARGEATDRERQAARDAARDAAAEAIQQTARDAAWAAMDAAWGDAMDAAWNAAWAFSWAASRNTAWDAAMAAAIAAALRDMAILVRQHLPLWRVALAMASLEARERA